MKRYFLSFAAMIGVATCAASPAFASSQSGTVTKLTQVTGRFFFELSGSRTTMPGCSCCNRWEISTASVSDQAMISIVLTAFAQNKAVQITGTASCVAGSNDTEAISFINTDY